MRMDLLELGSRLARQSMENALKRDGNTRNGNGDDKFFVMRTGFEPAPMKTTALTWRLRPLGHLILLVVAITRRIKIYSWYDYYYLHNYCSHKPQHNTKERNGNERATMFVAGCGGGRWKASIQAPGIDRNKQMKIRFEYALKMAETHHRHRKDPQCTRYYG